MQHEIAIGQRLGHNLYGEQQGAEQFGAECELGIRAEHMRRSQRADGAIELLRVKPDGKREMEASAWAAGLHQSQLAWEHV